MTGDGLEDINGYGTMKPKNLISSILGGTPGKPKSLAISNPHDFRQVCLGYTVRNYLSFDVKYICDVNSYLSITGIGNNRCGYIAGNLPSCTFVETWL